MAIIFQVPVREAVAPAAVRPAVREPSVVAAAAVAASRAAAAPLESAVPEAWAQSGRLLMEVALVAAEAAVRIVLGRPVRLWAGPVDFMAAAAEAAVLVMPVLTALVALAAMASLSLRMP